MIYEYIILYISLLKLSIQKRHTTLLSSLSGMPFYVYSYSRTISYVSLAKLSHSPFNDTPVCHLYYTILNETCQQFIKILSLFI